MALQCIAIVLPMMFTCLRVALAAPPEYSCLGEYQLCSDKGDCVLDGSLCGTCGTGQYLCPDRKTCVTSAEAYTTCPQLKGGFLDWTLSLDERVEALAKQATLQEQIAQLTNDAPAIVRLGIPAYNWLNDDEHGVRQHHATSFPNGCALGATWDKQTMLQVGRAVGQEARALHNGFVHQGNRGHGVNGAGITMYAPNMNLVRDPRWGRAQEVYSEDPVLSSYLTYMFVHGAQVGNESEPKYMQAAACCKHYAAYDLETIPTFRYFFSAQVDSRNMWETYMPVFRACVHFAEAAHVMCSYNAINGVPTCGDPKLLNGVLRDQWKWPGFVVSDYDAWAQIYETHAFCPNMTCAAATGLNAGMDQEGGGSKAIAQLQPAIDAGMTSAEAVATAFKRLFRVRLQLGMHDPPHMVDWNYLRNESIVENDEHVALARTAAQRAIVLYKNRDSVLPLSASAVRKVALIGPTAITGDRLLGNYASTPDAGVPSIMCGIQLALGDRPEPSTRALLSGDTCNKMAANRNGDAERVVYSPGCLTLGCEITLGFREAVDTAAGADVIVLVLGLDQVFESELHDRGHIELPGKQAELCGALRRAHPGTLLVVVLVHGGTLALGGVVNDADAILDAWYPGMMGGLAIGDVLFGKANPAGRAAVTSYLKTADLPAMGDMNLYAGNGSNGITYRYFTGDVQFPFGYGLSYTTFNYSNIRLSSVSIKACDSVNVTVTVTNMGDMDGDEVVQVYVKQINASVPVPIHRLANFERVAIAKGASVVVEMEIEPSTHCIVPDSDDIYTDQRTVEKGPVLVYVGGGQPNSTFTGPGLRTEFTVTNTQVLATC